MAEEVSPGTLGWLAALAQAQAGCERIERARWNDHAKTHYASSGDVVGLLRGALHEAGLVVCEVGSVPQGDVVEITYMVAHVETGHERRFVHRSALPTQLKDKALSAARTVGLRDFLRGLLIPHMADVDEGPRHAPGAQRAGAARPAGPRPVSLSALPMVLAASDLLALDDRDAYDLCGVPRDRGEQLVEAANRCLGADLRQMNDQERGQALASLQRRQTYLQDVVHRWGIELLCLGLAGKAAVPTPAEVNKLRGDELLSLRRRLEVELRGQVHGWQMGPCNSCGGASTRVKTCRICDGVGTVRMPKPAREATT